MYVDEMGLGYQQVLFKIIGQFHKIRSGNQNQQNNPLFTISSFWITQRVVGLAAIFNFSSDTSFLWCFISSSVRSFATYTVWYSLLGHFFNLCAEFNTLSAVQWLLKTTLIGTPRLHHRNLMNPAVIQSGHTDKDTLPWPRVPGDLFLRSLF